jgi:FkbM family methyltransferase
MADSVACSRSLCRLIAHNERRVVEGRVEAHAIEPEPRTFARLTSNIRANGLSITAHRLALSNFSGRALLYVPSVSSLDASLLPAYRVGATPVDVEVTTLDTFSTRRR